MALIAMAVYCTEENKRDGVLEVALNSLRETVDFNRHRIMLSVNGMTNKTMPILTSRPFFISEVFFNEANLGTAQAINKIWKLREAGEHCIKMDDDIVINSPGWVDELEEAIRRDPAIGQIGLKRKDCWEWPGHEHPDWRSELHMLPHIPGEPWQIIEKVKHVIGSCVMHNAALLDKVGYLYQPSLYGYDDVIMSHRTHLAGFYSCFLPHINIDHIDPGDTPYQSWKERHSGEQTQAVINLVHEMYNGTKPIYYGAE
jgi:GT2 family glycosyltransferase